MGRFLTLFALAGFASLAVACEQIAIVGRPSIAPEGAYEGSDLVGEVERVDPRREEIVLRTRDGRTAVVSYERRSRVLYRGRELPLEDLRPGEQVAVRVRGGERGVAVADLVRIREEVGDRGHSARGGGLETLEGVVERIDDRRGFFELRPARGRTVRVVVADVRERDELVRLREGDRVRIEGRFRGEEFELASVIEREGRATGREIR
jgi:predicted DNA-binding antitoxin AbrB/MazE fold protein